MERVLLTEQNVIELFQKCMALPEEHPEFDSTVIIKNFVAPKGTRLIKGGTSAFWIDETKVESHKEEIANLIDQIYNINEGLHYENMGHINFLESWTEDFEIIDVLFVLGYASNLIKSIPPMDELKPQTKQMGPEIVRVGKNATKQYQKQLAKRLADIFRPLF